MKKIHKFSLIIFLFVMLLACSTNRVYVEEDLYQTAQVEFGFSEVYFFKIVDPDTAMELTGTAFQNSGLIVGRLGSSDRAVFVPRKTDVEMFIVPFPYGFSMVSIMEQLESLEDESGNPLFVDPSGDYGGLSIGVSVYESLVDENPQLVFDTEIIFTFTTDEAVFHCASVNNQCKIFSAEFLLLN